MTDRDTREEPASGQALLVSLLTLTWLTGEAGDAGLAGSGEVESVEVHDLVPGRDEVMDELFAGVRGPVDLS